MNDRSAAKSDYEIIKPPVNLSAKVRRLGPREAANFDPVAAAESALQNLSGHFNNWMDQETDNLMAAWVDIQDNGLDSDRRDTIFRIGHDIKGQAATLGFPLAGAVADSLCRLLESVPDLRQIPDRLIEQHVRAVRAIVAEDARDAEDQIGRKLAAQLADVTDDFIARMQPAVD